MRSVQAFALGIFLMAVIAAALLGILNLMDKYKVARIIFAVIVASLMLVVAYLLGDAILEARL